MVTYKITLENGESQTTQTGKDLYCSILDKFNIKYTIEEINSNDIPHSDFRRMESEGVYEEKFGEPNFSSVSGSDSYNHTYFHDEWNQDITEDIEVKYIQSLDWREEILKREFGGNNLDMVMNDMVKDSDIQDFEDDDAYVDGIDERPIKKDVEYNDDEFDY